MLGIFRLKFKAGMLPSSMTNIMTGLVCANLANLVFALSAKNFEGQPWEGVAVVAVAGGCISSIFILFSYNLLTDADMLTAAGGKTTVSITLAWLAMPLGLSAASLIGVLKEAGYACFVSGVFVSLLVLTLFAGLHQLRRFGDSNEMEGSNPRAALLLRGYVLSICITVSVALIALLFMKIARVEASRVVWFATLSHVLVYLFWLFAGVAYCSLYTEDA